MNMLSTIRFVERMASELAMCREQSCTNLVYEAARGRRNFTNSAYLLGSFMILKCDKSPEQVAECFAQLDRNLFEDYRDASQLPSVFGLKLKDCWDGLYRGKMCGWINRPSSPTDPFWGCIDKDMYEHYDNLFNADLHEIVPEKLIAFRGPRDLGGASYRDDSERRSRLFAPEHYFQTLRDLGVSTVVRLCEAEYDRALFEGAGFEHHDLPFDDCAEPPGTVVAAFLRIVQGATGVVAVHCRAGLGRTGTLIALYMMKHHGFSAREAMGWVRIMRPGSVLGEQQRFLCTVERLKLAKAAAKTSTLRASRSTPDLAAAGVVAAAPHSGHGIRKASAGGGVLGLARLPSALQHSTSWTGGGGDDPPGWGAEGVGAAAAGPRRVRSDGGGALGPSDGGPRNRARAGH